MRYVICIILLIIISRGVAEAPPEEGGGEVYKIPPPTPPPEDPYKINKDLYILHPAFRNKVIMFIYECKKQGIELEIVETYRTPERQDMLLTQGATTLRGGRSKHQHKIAIDVVPVKFGWYLWYDKKLWKKIGKIGEAQGLVWGGRWHFYDPGHFEYPISVDEIHSLSIPDTVYVPLNF